MKRGAHYTFSNDYKGYRIRVNFWREKPQFTCDVIKEKKSNEHTGDYTSDKMYEDLDQLIAAIDRYDLSLRKDFTNKKAFRITGRNFDYEEPGKVEEVEVTSIIDDRQCWIKAPTPRYGNGRQQENLADLFTTREACIEYLKTMKAHDAEYKKVEAKAKAKLNESLWKPQQ